MIEHAGFEFRDALTRVAAGEVLTREVAAAAMAVIMDGRASPAQIGAFLLGLRSRGETADEITGCAEAIRSRALPVPHRYERLVDTCGTGGDGASTFNISTTAAFIVAGAGQKVAKHGNRAISSQTGSADVLDVLDLLGEWGQAAMESPPRGDINGDGQVDELDLLILLNVLSQRR